MQGADLAICWRNYANFEVRCYDYLGVGNALPPLDAENNVLYMQDSYTASTGRWSVKFRRYLNTEDAEDYKLVKGNTMNMLFAHGNWLAGTGPDKHNAKGILKNIVIDNNYDKGHMWSMLCACFLAILAIVC